MTTSTWKDKALFTPGPLTTSRTVKQAMLRDLGSRDGEFIAIVRDVRERLVRLAEVDIDTHTTVLMQGSGTFGLEAVLATCVPRGKKLLCAINGAYGRRMAAIGRTLGIDVVELSYAEDAPIVPADIEKALAEDADIAMVTCCHCETTSGILNPIAEVGAMVQAAGRDFYVDAMSSFGAIDTNVAEMGIDYLVSSANKCIEGVPGFSFCVAKLDKLLACEGNARSISLDLVAQYKGLESNGQFRFTPPTHAILAFHQALLELEEEGGVAGRGARYRANHEIIAAGMTAMGFRRYLKPELQAPIITSFYYPDDPNFDFTKFYSLLAERGYVIYPGKVGDADCFRIGNIGRLFPNDMRDLLSAVSDVLAQMDVRLKGVA